MFFLASKLAGILAIPSTLLVLLVGAGLAVPGRVAGGRRLAAGAAALLALAGFGPVAGWALLPLEERFPAFADEGGPVDGVVVLGGAVDVDVTDARGQLTTGEAGERLVAMADLARRHPAARIVFSGGAGDLVGEAVPEADLVRRYASTLALDPARVVWERRSRTTAENARETRALVTPEPGSRWLLVTSARHMPRAVGCFRHEGFPVIAYPVDYRTAGPSDLRTIRVSASVGLQRLDDAVREWIGLVAYRLSGRTDALFPAP